jgi:glutamate synthase (NADPH/NADH) small chain
MNDQGERLPVGGMVVQVIARTEDGKFQPTEELECIPIDSVVQAIGNKPAARIVSTTTGIEVDEKGFVITRERPYGMTTRAGVFSSGDVVHGPATVVLAMKESKKVAAGIAQYVDAKRLISDCGL